MGCNVRYLATLVIPGNAVCRPRLLGHAGWGGHGWACRAGHLLHRLVCCVSLLFC
jgi:hypothetical protein